MFVCGQPSAWSSSVAACRPAAVPQRRQPTNSPAAGRASAASQASETWAAFYGLLSADTRSSDYTDIDAGHSETAAPPSVFDYLLPLFALLQAHYLLSPSVR